MLNNTDIFLHNVLPDYITDCSRFFFQKNRGISSGCRYHDSRISILVSMCIPRAI